MSPGLLYHLTRRDTGRLANETFTSNPIVSSKQQLSGLKITNWSRKTRQNSWNTLIWSYRLNEEPPAKRVRTQTSTDTRVNTSVLQVLPGLMLSRATDMLIPLMMIMMMKFQMTVSTFQTRTTLIPRLLSCLLPCLNLHWITDHKFGRGWKERP